MERTKPERIVVGALAAITIAGFGVSAIAGFAVVSTAGFALGCSPPSQPPERAPAADRRLETVDVTEQPDASASLETDRHEPRFSAAAPGRGGIAGALPEGFPRDVPLPRPSSLVDFDAGSVTLEVAGGLEGVRTAYLRQLAGAGFAARDGGRWQKGPRAIRVGFAPLTGATRVTVELVPAS
jgi:hypothetical protein